MRLDVFLHRVCILKSRTMAKEACDRGKVTVNGRAAKASQTVQSGDRIALTLGARVVVLDVTAIPEGNESRKDARNHYDLLRDEHREV
jgi:ribosome-associated heat shock protein Hsp15